MQARALGAAILMAVALTPVDLRAQVTSKPDPERAAVQQVIVQLGERLQAGDLTGAEALMRPRLHILTDNATLHSWVEYRDKYVVPDLSRLKGGYAHTAVEATVRGDLSYVVFRRVFGKEGSPSMKEGRGTAVLEKVDGKWAIVQLQMAE